MKSETGKDYMKVIENIFDEEKIKEYRPIRSGVGTTSLKKTS